MKTRIINLLAIIVVAAVAMTLFTAKDKELVQASPTTSDSPIGTAAGFWPIVPDAKIAETLLGSWTDVGEMYRITFAGSWVNAGSSVYFEAVLNHPESGKSMLAKLQYWNGSGWMDVPGSTVSTFSGYLRRYRSGAIAVPSDEKEYRIVIDGNGISKSGYLWRASILVIPSSVIATRTAG